MTTAGDGAGARQPDRPPGGMSVAGATGAVLYVLEVVAVGFLGMAVGGLSAMHADTCFPASTELICEPRWQTVLASTPVTALALTVVAMVVLVRRVRQPWAVATAFVATPVVPLLAFLLMQAVVTA